MEKNDEEKYFYLTSNYNWKNENIGVKSSGISNLVSFENIIRRTNTKTVTEKKFLRKVDRVEIFEETKNVPVLVQLFPNHVAKDVLTGVEFKLYEEDKNKIWFGIDDIWISKTGIDAKDIVEYLKSFNKEDVKRYNERMSVFQDTIKKVEKDMLDKSIDNIQYLKDFKERDNNN